MSDLKSAILDAKYIDMVSLADFVVRDCGIPAEDEDGGLLPQQNEIAAAIFRWAAMSEAGDASEELEEASSSDDESDTKQTGPANWPNVGTAKDNDVQKDGD